MPLSPGQRLAQYEVLSSLGSGGMGEVYRARDQRLDREVAIKVMAPHVASDPEMRRRFETEAKAVAALSHPGILSIYELVVVDGVPVAVMELLEGESLRQRLRRGPIEWREAVRIAASVAEGLAAAHAKGVVHRDLKPDNVFLVPDPGAPGAIRVKILDFGIAKLTGRALAGQPGRPRTKNLILGTPAYMAPEQCRGATELDARADLYAVGCLLFELLTGRPPFVASGDGEVMAMHIYEPPPRLSNLAPHLPVELDALLAKLLAKDPADRIPSAAYALATLERAPVAPLVDEVALSGAHYAIGPAAHAALVPGIGDAQHEPMPRWIPVAVIGGALAIAVAAAVAIGIT